MPTYHRHEQPVTRASNGQGVIYDNPLNAELNPIRHLLALVGARHIVHVSRVMVNPLNAELNPIRHLLALVGARHIDHVSRIRVNVAESVSQVKYTL